MAAVLMAALTGCASEPRAQAPTAEQPVPINTAPAGSVAVIPAPVPVLVAPEARPAASPEATAEVAAQISSSSAAAGAAAAEERDLLDRVRAGLKLGEFKQSRIDREADWFANNPEFIERVFTRAAPYMQYIVSQVEARGLPMELALLPIIESAFEPYAYSRARAVGLWQFMTYTGSRFSLKQDWWYDGRRDVVAATQAALDYMEYLHEMFDGDWLLAIAAYNCGEGNVARAVRNNRKAGRKVDFWNLRLPTETKGYVPRLLAMTRIVANPARYGLSIEGIPDEPYFKQVETGGQISLEVAAQLAGITTQDMYELNPAYHRWATDPTGPNFLLVPVESADVFQVNLLQLTPDQRLRVERYSVRDGDTVNSIATKFGTTAAHLRELNGLGDTNSIEIGSELRVPSSVSALPPKVLQAAARVDNRGSNHRVRAVHVVRRGDSLWSIAKRHDMDVITLANLNRIDPTDTLRSGQKLVLSAQPEPASITDGPNTAKGRRVTYVVRRGDTLSDIARTLRVTLANLRSWNDLSRESTIKPGQRLIAFVRRGT